MVPDDPAWEVTITPKQNPFDFGFREVWRSRDLIALFVRRNFIVNYRQTVLGPIWYVLQPLLTTAVFTVVFGLVKMPTDGIPPALFYLSGVVLWSNFSVNLMSTSDIFVANMGLFGKVYFPRLTVPIATVLTNCITLTLHLSVFFLVFIVAVAFGNGIRPTVWVVLCPLLFAANIFLALGVGLILSALTTRYRDLASIVGTAMQLWMYATPIFYPLSQIPAQWRPWIALNPMSTSVELMREMAFGVGSVSLAQIAISLCVVVAVLVGGLMLFHRAEMSAADTV
jgi:lipopolysaccharide transport system permease protein